MSCLACGMGMPRVKRLHHHRPHHGTHVPVAGAPGKVSGWGVRVRESERHGSLTVTGEPGRAAAVCTGR